MNPNHDQYPEGETFRQSLGKRYRTASLWQTLFFSALVIAVLSLVALLYNVIDGAFGYVAFEYRNNPTEFTSKPLEDLNKQKAVLPHSFVRVYIGMNEKKKAMEWMEESFKQRQAGLIVLGIEPSYDFLRDEPRFQRMLAELKLADGRERR